jgi:hypothetical protein
MTIEPRAEDGMRLAPFAFNQPRPKGPQDASHEAGPRWFRVQVGYYRNWTNYYGSTFMYSNAWIGPVKVFVKYDHFRWPEYSRERGCEISWLFNLFGWRQVRWQMSWSR